MISMDFIIHDGSKKSIEMRPKGAEIFCLPNYPEVWYTVRRSPDHGIHGREDEKRIL